MIRHENDKNHPVSFLPLPPSSLPKKPNMSPRARSQEFVVVPSLFFREREERERESRDK